MKVCKIKTGLILFAAAALAFPGCRGEGAEAKKKANSGDGQIAYQTVTVRPEEIAETVELTGIVQALREVEISAEIPGKITAINCDTGDTVNQGDVLVELDDEEKRIILKKKRALLKKAEATTQKTDRDSQKAETLFKDGVISDSEYDDSSLNSTISEADLDLARAEVLSAEKALRDTRITAPFCGKIAAREAEVGDITAVGQPLLTLVDIRQVKITADVSEFDAAKIAVGNNAEIAIDSLPDRTFSGKVHTLGLKAAEDTRTYPVEILLSNPEQVVLPGMVVRAAIQSAKPRKVITLPAEAVKKTGDRSSVQLFNDGRPIRKMVETEKWTGEKVIVRSGLEAGEKVVIGVQP